MIPVTNKSFSEAIDQLQEQILQEGEVVHTDMWQSKKANTNEYDTIEILNNSFTVEVPEGVSALRKDIHPNLPWAEDHFQERVSGEPLNPGVQYRNWPFYKEERGMREVLPTGNEGPLFSHTYMERFWTPAKPGIRYAWGNLDDVISLLLHDPLTRQAYFPIWFPEDTGAGSTSMGYTPRRVPCTLGYHFLLRESHLHMWYDIRSCDIMRQLNDDIYLAARLLQWVRYRLYERSIPIEGEVYKIPPISKYIWATASLGTLTMNIHSLHMFTQDRDILAYRRKCLQHEED